MFEEKEKKRIKKEDVTQVCVFQQFTFVKDDEKPELSYLDKTYCSLSFQATTLCDPDLCPFYKTMRASSYMAFKTFDSSLRVLNRQGIHEQWNVFRRRRI